MEHCPYCGQPITHKKLEQIKVKIRKELVDAVVGERKKMEWQFKAKDSELKRKYEEMHRRDLENSQKKLEKERETGVYQGRMEGAKERESFMRQIKGLQRDLENKPSEEIGSVSEEQLAQLLKQKFPDDIIERVPKGESGADIKQTIRYHSEPCGTIIYESKNVKSWQNSFLTKAQKYKSFYGTPHIILATTAFPEKDKNLTIKKGIILVNHEKAPYIASLLRTSIIQLEEQKLSEEERGVKVSEIYEYMRSNDFDQRMQAICESVDRLKDLQGKERKTHERTWAQQETEYKEVVANADKISSKVSAILSAPVSKIKAKGKRRNKQLVIR